jgi:hypothetical protein
MQPKPSAVPPGRMGRYVVGKRQVLRLGAGGTGGWLPPPPAGKPAAIVSPPGSRKRRG